MRIFTLALGHSVSLHALVSAALGIVLVDNAPGAFALIKQVSGSRIHHCHTSFAAFDQLGMIRSAKLSRFLPQVRFVSPTIPRNRHLALGIVAGDVGMGTANDQQQQRN